jgi:hypothetical protein
MRQLEEQSAVAVRRQYEDVIAGLIAKSDRRRAKAEELGIVLESPEDFLRSQIDSIKKNDEKARSEGIH